MPDDERIHASTGSAARADGGSDEARQRIVKTGPRRARLTAVPGTEPEPAVDVEDDAPVVSPDGGPNDARMRADVPPHY